RRDRPPGRVPPQARRNGRGPRPGCGRAPLDGAEARAPAGVGGPTHRRARGALLGVEDVLRADLGAGHDRARVRGPAVGRYRPPRLHRVDAGVVAEPPDPDRRPLAARPRRPATGLGSGAAELHVTPTGTV